MVSGGVGMLAYPWEFAIDSRAAAALARSGARAVAVAGAYHAVRALRATPGPGPRVVEQPHAACYWTPSDRYPPRLRPAEPPSPWRGSAPTAVAACRAAGLPVGAWLSVLHSTRLAVAAPDLALVNCHGDVYRHALCPSHDEVAEYARTLVADAVAALEPDWLELEAVGFHGYRHDSLHDKAGIEVDASLAHLLSLCFCAGCRRALAGAGLDPDRLAKQVATAADERLIPGATGPDDADGAIRAALAVRALIVDTFVAQVADVAQGAGVPVAVHAALPATTVGSRVPLSPSLVAVADAVVLATDGLAADAASLAVSAAVERTGDRCPVLASVRCFPPDVRGAADLRDRLTGAAVAGGAGARLHTFGLIGAAQLSWLAAADPWGNG